MKKKLILLISILIVNICLLPSAESFAEYNPTPEIIPALTETPIDGQLCRIACQFWGDTGLYYCRSAAEQAEIENDPSCWIVDIGDPCKKCSINDDTWLTEVNGVETCLHDPPCPNDYEYGTYYGEDGCIKCPDDYLFDEGTCRWVGTGPPPSAPPPTIPRGLTASRNASPVNVIVSWWESNIVTDYYILERAPVDDPQNPFNFQFLAKVNSENGPGNRVKYYDNTATPAGTEFYYQVKACDEKTGKCSGYSNYDIGKTGTVSIPSILTPLLLLPGTG